MSLCNPVIPGFHPDPSVCRVGNEFFLVNSSCGYFPGVPIFRSRDLLSWEQIGHALTRESQLPLGTVPVSEAGIFAPTLRWHNGRFYLITTNVGNGGNFIVTADDPAGQWSDPVWIDPTEGAGIDPSLFFDDDGSVYFTGTANDQIRQFKIDLETGKPLDEPRRLWPGTGGQWPEGPHLFRREPYYYLTMAEGGTEYGHMQTIARAPSAYGPWEPCPHNPILTHRSRKSGLQALGHSDFVQSPDGRWWLVFHAIRPAGYPYYHVCGRETCVAPVEWTPDGWPIVNGGELIPLGSRPPGKKSTDHFEEPVLGLDWNYIRNPVPTNYRLGERHSQLGLVPAKDSLTSLGRPTFVGKRQTEPSMTVRAQFDFTDLEEGDEGGLTVFQNETHHYEIAAQRLDGVLGLIVRRRIGDLEAIVARAGEVCPTPILEIAATPEQYTFAYQEPDGVRVELAQGATRYLGTETAGKFTGCYFGLFAVGAEDRDRPGVWIDGFTDTSVT